MSHLKSSAGFDDGKSEKSDRSDDHFVFDSSEDEEISMIFGFKEDEARNRLLSFPKTTRLVISPDLQAEIGMEIGKAVSVEHPWKEIKKEVLEDHIPDKTKEQKQLKDKLKELNPGKLILVGYLPELSTEEDTFVVFVDDRETKEASDLIRRIEVLERHKARGVLKKRPRKWQDQGSHAKVLSFIPVQRTNIVNLETQSIFPVKRCSYVFTNRFVKDVRDGYVELVPGKLRFNNIQRKLVDFAVQIGPPKVHQYQQTDPTFPTNAWSQYLYEITDEEREAANKSTVATGNDNQAPKPNSYVQELLNTLEFNQVDMYKNDYPCISYKKVQKYQTPIVEECFCFSDRAKCGKRYVSAIDWHPVLSGILVAAYNFETLCTIKHDGESDTNPIDLVNRIVFENCPVLMWCFDDTLNPKLELRSDREVTALSFCPYDGNLLLGGLVTGQIIIWDLSRQLDRVERVEDISPTQLQYRREIKAMMGLFKDEVDRTVEPVAISAMDKSPRRSITVIKWLPRNTYCAGTGQIRAVDDKLHRFIMTASVDGSVCFWDLDFSPPASKTTQTSKTVMDGKKSAYQHLDNAFHPIFRVKCETSVTSISVDEALFQYVPDEIPKELSSRVVHRATSIAVEFRMKVVYGSLMGGIACGTWQGHDFDQGTGTNEEAMKTDKTFASIHDGPVIAVERNPFCMDIFLSIGGRVLAVWSEKCVSSAIFWRKRKARLTAGRWSLDRAAVFFIIDSNVRIDMPCLVTSLGGHMLSYLSQHKLSATKKFLAVADYNSNIRILIIPSAFSEPFPNEKKKFRKFIQHQLSCRELQDKWIQNYYEAHKDSIDAQLKAKREAKEMAERMEVEQKERDEFLKRQAIEEAKKKSMRDAEKRVDMAKRSDARWRHKSYKRLLRSMMERRNINPGQLAKQMHPEKEIRKYNEEKQVAIAEDLARIEQDYEEVKAQLIPVKKVVVTRTEQLKEKIQKFKDEIADYTRVEIEAREVLENFQLPPVACFTDILIKGRQRRDIINRDLGANLVHLESYQRKKMQRKADISEGYADVESTTSVTSPDALQRARSVTFIDDVPQGLVEPLAGEQEPESERKNTPITDE
ncbi:dynein axonemal intermediate chain 3 isoform X2 [Toxorhynchites rutilus septentrionalis]|uniref:dynein axonemal intermediate chain 3 isoform X2 n=1 Tax=Toxorhynchites rutilus septentrionalis TaxID=329112 RepID=UPI00247AACD7|nr:dynein axonemal intermediate chain 3 isoform X2 [Toxorhynchites rutilus septentrionalis]